MAVFVDDQRAKYGRLVLCHMISSSEDELHAMADRIGVDRRWWESPLVTSGSHYNICQSKKALALSLGAIQITSRQAAAMNRRRHVTGELGSPEDAVSWLKTYLRARSSTDQERPLSPLIV